MAMNHNAVYYLQISPSKGKLCARGSTMFIGVNCQTYNLEASSIVRSKGLLWGKLQISP